MMASRHALKKQLEVLASYVQKQGFELIQRQPNRYNSVGSLVSDLTNNWKQAITSKPTDNNDDHDSKIPVTFIRPDGSKISVRTDEGKTLYDAVIDNNVDIDGFGACEGTLCCTTCHLIFKQSDYEKVGEPRSEELDMLDLAYGLTDTSRLGCQVKLKREFGPLEVQVPAGINDVTQS